MEIPENSKLEKILKNNKWYHGTSLAGYRSIIEKKVEVAYNKGTELDFGYGFYLAPSAVLAEKFITRIIALRNSIPDFSSDADSDPKNRTEEEVPVVLEFEINPLNYFKDSQFNCTTFLKYNEDFAEFVFKNRTENVLGENQHDFDMIYGVMSDSKPTLLIEKYKNNEISLEEVISGLQISTSSKQLSIHNQEICGILKLTKAYAIESREELNVDGYNIK